MSNESTASFSALVISLATTAAVHFGDMPEPGATGAVPVDLVGAAQMIEILEMLHAKTQGNLTADEQQLLDQILYELRMRFVTAQGRQKTIIEP